MTDAPLITEEFINRLIEYSEDLGQKLEPWQVLKLREYLGKPFPEDVASGAYLTGLRKVEPNYTEVPTQGLINSLNIADEISESSRPEKPYEHIVTPDTSQPGWDLDITFENEIPLMEILEQGGPEVPSGGRRTPSNGLSGSGEAPRSPRYYDGPKTSNVREPLNRAERRLADKQSRRKR